MAFLNRYGVTTSGGQTVNLPRAADVVRGTVLALSNEGAEPVRVSGWPTVIWPGQRVHFRRDVLEALNGDWPIWVHVPDMDSHGQGAV